MEAGKQDSQWIAPRWALDGLAILGAVCWTIRLLAQLLNNYRRRRVVELEGWNRPLLVAFVTVSWLGWGLLSQTFTGMHFLMAGTGMPMAVMANINVFGMFVLTAQIMLYEMTLAFLMVPSLTYCAVTLEILDVPEGRTKCANNPTGSCADSIAIIALVFLCLGWLPLYVESWKHQGRAVTVPFTALCVGMGGSYSILCSLSLREHDNNLETAIYVVMCSLDFVLITSHLIWWVRTYEIRQVYCKAMGLTFDEVAREMDKDSKPFPFSASRKWTLQDETVASFRVPYFLSNAPLPRRPGNVVFAGPRSIV